MTTQQQDNANKPARAGAMTMAMQAVQVRAGGPKILRVMVAQGDDERVTEEKLIRKRETVTVGASEDNHFVIGGMPAKFELFQVVGNDYILNFTEDMTGRVSLPGGVQELEQLRKTGAARNAGAHWQVKLADTSKGRVRIGSNRILFQFVDAPPVQPRPQLPASVIGGFAASVDWLFTAFVMFSFMSHFGLVVFLENADWPVTPANAAIPERLAELIFNEPEPPKPPEEEQPTEEDAPTEEAPTEVAEAPSNRPSENTESSSNSEPSERQQAANSEARVAAEQAAAQVEQMLLGALGGESGSLADALRGGAPPGSAQEVLDQANGVGVATTAGGGVLRDRAGGDRVGAAGGDLGSMRAAGGGAATASRGEGQALVESGPRGRFRPPADVEDESGSGDFDVQTVVRQIRTRQSAIQRCYETELRQNNQLSGRVKISLTIQESGAVSGVRALENTTGSDAVATCVVRVIQGFRFNPGPDGGSVTYAFPFVFEPQR